MFNIFHSDSTSHGLPRVIKSKYIVLKILWGLAFIAGLAASLYYLVISIISYLQYQPVVQVTLIQEFPTLFPAITICNLNPFENLNRSAINQSDFFNEESFNSKNIEYYFVEAQENFKRAVTNMGLNQKQAIGFQLKEKLISCTFNNEICDSSNFTSFFDYDYGNCFTYNGGENGIISSTTQIGSKYGLTLEILTGDPLLETLPFMNQGLLLVVHNQTKKLVPSILLINGIYLPPGYNSYVSVSRHFNSKLSSPYSNCITDLTTSQTFGTTLYNYMTSNGISTYDQASCVRLCYQSVVQSSCNCYDPKYPALGNITTKCLNVYQIECILNVTDKIFLRRNDYINICGFDCPIECNTIDYYQSCSSSYYPSEYYVNLLAKKNYLQNFNLNSSFASIQNSVRNYLVKVTINYNELGYTFMEEQPSIDMFTLIGNVGGQFGLFIGISLLSIVEVLELSIDIIILSRKKY